MKTYRVVRRQRTGESEWRENGELIPEAHTWRLVDAYVHGGELEEAFVEPAEFVAAVEKYVRDPQLAEHLYKLTGTQPGSNLLSTTQMDDGQMRQASMVPTHVFEGMNPETASTPQRPAVERPVDPVERSERTVVATEIGPNRPSRTPPSGRPRSRTTTTRRK